MFEHILFFVYAIFCVILFGSFFLIYFFLKKKRFFHYFQNKEEIYNFGKIGLVLVDNKNNILWINNFLRKKIDSIQDFKSKLKKIKINKNKKDESNKILINSINYEFEFFEEMNLYIFRDIEDLSSTLNELNNNSLVLGEIIIDNYPTINIDDYNDNLVNYIFKIRNIIFDYAKKFNLFIKKISVNKYLVVCNFLSLKNMETDEFSLIKEIRELKNEKNEIPLTLSIVFAYGNKDLNFINDLIDNAMNIISNRGGDQAVVCKDYDNFIFYNKKKNLSIIVDENENKTKIINYANSLIKEIKKSNQIFILGHKNIDLDALGSCLGILKICHFFRKKSYIIYDVDSIELNTKDIFNFFLKNEISNITISPVEAVKKINSETLIVIVDCNEKQLFLEDKILDKTNSIIIIDHHVFGKNRIKIPTIFSYIDSNSSSCSELIIELINYSLIDVKINNLYANIILAGILIDSNFFNSCLVSSRTFEAVSFLIKSGAEKSLVYNLLSDNLEINELISKVILSLKKTKKKGIVYCLVDSKVIKNSRTFLSKIAYHCIQIRDIDAIFVIGEIYNDEIYILGRSNEKINVQLILERIGGGGSFTSAFAKIKNKSILDVENMLLNIINDENCSFN